MKISLVIPAYNEAGRIGGTVTRVCQYLEQQAYEWELIVVIDGGPKAAADEARAAAGARSNVRVIENDGNRGKGYSVRRASRPPPAIGWCSSTPTCRCRSKGSTA